MNAKERMKSGKIYFCTDEELAKEQLRRLDRLYDFNQTRPSEMPKRMALLKEILAEVGENCYVEPPLHANWGCHTHFGNNVYANFNLTLVDDTDIYVGDGVLFGPNVVVAVAGHPVDPDLRRKSRSSIFPCTSATMSGSARAQSSSPASRSATTPSSGPEAWSRSKFPRMSSPSATPAACSAKSANTTANTTGATGKSRFRENRLVYLIFACYITRKQEVESWMRMLY